MHLFVAGVPSTDLGIMMHILFPQLFSMNVEGNVRRSSFVKTCQFHHGKQNTTLFGLCIQYNSKHDFYILYILYVLLYTFMLFPFNYFILIPLSSFARFQVWTMWKWPAGCHREAQTCDKLCTFLRDCTPFTHLTMPAEHHWSWGNQNLDIGAARITYCKGQQNVAWCSIKWAL